MKAVKMKLDEQIRVITDNQFKLYLEMGIADRHFSEEEQKRFIDATDPDITIEVTEEQMIPEELEFNDFYKLYQVKHLLKYNEELSY